VDTDQKPRRRQISPDDQRMIDFAEKEIAALQVRIQPIRANIERLERLIKDIRGDDIDHRRPIQIIRAHLDESGKPISLQYAYEIVAIAKKWPNSKHAFGKFKTSLSMADGIKIHADHIGRDAWPDSVFEEQQSDDDGA